jgi:hypothetical protein
MKSICSKEYSRTDSIEKILSITRKNKSIDNNEHLNSSANNNKSMSTANQKSNKQ